MKDFRGKVAVVTGGASGIGRAMVERFVAEGMKAVLADIDEAALDTAVTEIRANGGDVLGVRTDVSRLDSVEALRDAAHRAYGPVHVLCNNAGVASGAYGRIWEHEINDWRFAFSVHVYGVINGIKAFVPSMMELGSDGHVINTSSNNGGFA
ncbi:MAG: SDR family NAD(P)-dependent oxidoreductase, partial [Actinomycetota bacterium]